MKTVKQIIALILVLALGLSIVGCAGQSTSQSSASSALRTSPLTKDSSTVSAPAVQDPALPTQQASSEGSIEESIESNAQTDDYQSCYTPLNLPAEEPDREELEQILDLVSTDSFSEDQLADLSDEDLTSLIEDLLEQPQTENPSLEAGPSVSVDTKTENIADDGTLEKPFDQIYPELMDQVDYSGESLMIKMENHYDGQISDTMQESGVGKLDLLFTMEDASWYEASLVAGTEITEAVCALRQCEEVLVVDYNYTARADAMAQAESITEAISGNAKVSDQWYLEYCGIPSGLNTMAVPGGSSNVIVAVIDTGVDYDHIDLADNIWTNDREIPDNGIDDDGNGYTDDYYGVNVITRTGNGDDDNGHGTHVAGIIAAQNNNLGTVGIAYNVKVMPIKALNSEGITDDVSIVNAIIYAVENGAEVINMSFGQEAMSLSVQEALAMASAQCVLVASAGNDGASNEGDSSVPNYPAALSYVLGVMSTDRNGNESSFSSYDSVVNNGIEYELYAPGEGILSTIPGDRYASWSGTSMAAPMVSAMAALLRSQYSDRETYTSQFICGQLTATSEHFADCSNHSKHGDHTKAPIVNLYTALTKLPQPDVVLSSYHLFDTKGFELDTSSLNNGDGVVDSGETIALGLTLRNRWGSSKNTQVSIVPTDSTYVTVHNSTADYGSVGTYSTADCGKIYTDELLTGWENPFYITISEDCPGNTVIELKVTVSSTNLLNPADTGLYTSEAAILLQVRNGTVLPTSIDEDMTLESGNLYIIYNATVIEEGVTVTAEPGAQIQFWSSDREDPYADQYIPSLTVKGQLLVEGTKDNPVQIFPGTILTRYNSQRSDLAVQMGTGDSGVISLIYADLTNFTDLENSLDTHNIFAYGCTFRTNSKNGNYYYYRYLYDGEVRESSRTMTLFFTEAENCVFYQLPYAVIYRGDLRGCAFVNSNIYSETGSNHLTYRDCLFLGNSYVETYDNGNGMTMNYQTSSYRAHTLYEDLSADRVEIYYRPETGTTYVTVHSYTEALNRLQAQMYVQALGGDFAVIGDESELSWLNARLPAHRNTSDLSDYNRYRYDLGLDYDFLNQRYEWSDGTAVGEFLQTEGLTDSYNGTTLYLLDGALGSSASRYYSEFLLFEIPGEIYITDIQLNQYNVLLDLGTTYQITVSTSPANVEPEKLVFVSDNEEVVTVDESGLVTPVGQGIANVTVSSADGFVSNYATFYVREYTPLEGLSFSSEVIQLAVGESTETQLVYLPQNTTRKAVTYISSDDSVATVDRYGRITAKAPGEATITATSTEPDADGNPISTELTVHVYRQVTGLTLSTNIVLTSMDKEGGTLPEGITLPECTIFPDNAEYVLCWRSTDPEVAEVDEESGEVTVKNSGTTTIVVTDRMSGLSTSFLLIVTGNGETPTIKDIQVCSSHHYVLTEEGKLYYWNDGDTYRSPTVIAQNVEQFVLCAQSLVFLQKTDGSLWSGDHGYLYSMSSFSGTVQAMAYGDSTYYILDDTGAVYYMRNRNSTWTLLRTMEDDVVQMTVGYDYAWFLTEYGEVYCTPTGSTSLQGPMAEGVSMLGKEVDIFSGTALIVLMENGYFARIEQTGYINNYTTPAPDNWDQIFFRANSNQYWTILDGVARSFYIDREGCPQLPGIDNAKNLSTTGYDVTYVVTEEGLLYAIGSGSYNNFAGASTDSQVTDPLLIPLTPVEDNLRITGNNLAQNAVLFAQELDLAFSNTLKEATPKLYADSTEIRFSSTKCDENHLIVSLKDSFQPGVNYRLVFPAGSITAPYGVTNEEEIAVSFTYGLMQTETELIVRTDAAPAQPNVLNISDWSSLNLNWYSTDEEIAIVGEDNLLQPIAPGRTTIRLSEAVTGFSCEFDVIVWEPLTEDTTETYDEEQHTATQYMALDGTNLADIPFGDAHWTLTQQELVLNFNKPVENVNYTLNAIVAVDNRGNNITEPVETTSQTDLDQVIITPVGDLTLQGIYELTVYGQGTTGTYAKSGDWTETFCFIYIPENPEEVIDTTVTRSSTTDDTVERFYWDNVSFTDAFVQKQEELNYNYRFYNNVILNRISTDTNPTHWLRIQADSSSTPIPLGSNYWGTTNETAIGLQIIDYYDFSTYSKIQYSPYLTEAPDNTFPFVTGLTIYDRSGNAVTHLSNQEITVRITFSRDMDTGVPLNLTFGNNYPYDQYTIEGSYVDSRTWEGSYILTAIVENGNHLFSISGGQSAEDALELFTDWGRFGFELDTASAQAMLMQAEATDEGIQLSWSQDDFDTLMGYNVYRSTGSENAYTQRINSTVIPAGTESYFDADVEPGVIYYYSFSVVQTDLSESTPSNKIRIMSKDTMAPDLYHTPVYTASLGSNLMITATVKDNVSISNVYVYYRTIGETEWNTAVMNHLNDKYSVLISGDQITAAGLEYYIEATDGDNSTFRGSSETPLQVEVIASTDSSSKGDVNGDGKISSLDALMLLQSINNLLYLDAEQFSRADLDSDGILEAMEALRILHYVSGKVGSVDMS